MSTYKVKVIDGELEAMSDNAYCRSSNIEQDDINTINIKR